MIAGGNHTTAYGRSPKSKDLRTEYLRSSIVSAKILRRASLAQDDSVVQ